MSKCASCCKNKKQHKNTNQLFHRILLKVIPKPVWAVGFALEQTLRDATLAVFSFANF
ncbi:MAG: hypothetical protein LBH59_03525 [Planctomycetaceae bacterium]|nr:hypothetical protein [Planctomycetaceae bacterium]